MFCAWTKARPTKKSLAHKNGNATPSATPSAMITRVATRERITDRSLLQAITIPP
jgi:hypothetical protein